MSAAGKGVQTTGQEDSRGGLGDVGRVAPEGRGACAQGKAGRSLTPAGPGAQKVETETKSFLL